MKFLPHIVLLIGLSYDANAGSANTLFHNSLNNYTETSTVLLTRLTTALGLPATKLAEVSKIRKSILKSHLRGKSILSARSAQKLLQGLIILRGKYPQHGTFIDGAVAELPVIIGQDRLLRKLLGRYEASFSLIRDVLRISDMSVEGLEKFSGLERGVLRNHMHGEGMFLTQRDVAKLQRGINDLKKYHLHYTPVLDEIVRTLPKSIEVERILQNAPQGFPQQLLEKAMATRDEAILEWKKSPEIFTDFWQQRTRPVGTVNRLN